ncbi:MAG: 3-phosphoshikimate 1-carboxyvinyltransferase [Treponema sp.]|nr:3-phosphoshikimate 1-carboxyvinyltransferase [Treponema sp.]
MIIRPSKAKGVMVAPPSKSMAHRHLICAALAEGTSVINNIDLSEDIKATLGCIKQLGANAEIKGNQIVVQGAGSFLGNQKSSSNNTTKKNDENPTRLFDCNESGSTLRFFIPLAMLSDSPAKFIGSEVLMTRPLSVYETICQLQGIKLQPVSGGIEVQGKLKSGEFQVPGNISSQFITGLLFTLPLLSGDSTIILTESVESKPYIDMTLQVQRDFGIKAEWKNENTLLVKGNQHYVAHNGAVEGDYSNAAFFEALNTLGGNVTIQGLKEDSLQGDKVYLQYFNQLKEAYCSVDISDCPDLGPILFTVAAALNGGEFTGTKRLKIKESNRGAVMCQELAKFGIKTLQEENRIIIYEGELHKPEETVFGHNDHRIVMSMATLMTITGGKIDGVGAVKKSLPDFFKRIKALGIDFDFENEDSNGLDN